MKIFWSFIWVFALMECVLLESDFTRFIEEDDNPKNTPENNNHPSTFEPATFTTLNLDEHLSDTSSNETQQNDIIFSTDLTSQNKYDGGIKEEEHETEYLGDELATENYETTTGTFPVSIKDIFQGKFPKEEDLKGINIIKNWLEEKKHGEGGGLFDPQYKGDESVKNEIMSTTYISTDKKIEYGYSVTSFAENETEIFTEAFNETTTNDQFLNNGYLENEDEQDYSSDAPIFLTTDENSSENTSQFIDQDIIYKNELTTILAENETNNEDVSYKKQLTTIADTSQEYENISTIVYENNFYSHEVTTGSENDSDNSSYSTELTTEEEYKYTSTVVPKDSFYKNDLTTISDSRMIENEIIDDFIMKDFPSLTKTTEEPFTNEYDLIPEVTTLEDKFTSEQYTTNIQDINNVEQNESNSNNDEMIMRTTTINIMEGNLSNEISIKTEKGETTTNEIIITKTEDSSEKYFIEEILFTSENDDYLEPNSLSTTKTYESTKDKTYENEYLEATTPYQLQTTNKQNSLEISTLLNNYYTKNYTATDEATAAFTTTTTTISPVIETSSLEESDKEIIIPNKPHIQQNFPRFDENVEEDILHLFKDELSYIQQVKTDDFEEKEDLEQDNNIILNTQAEEESNLDNTTTNAVSMPKEFTSTFSPKAHNFNFTSEYNKGENGLDNSNKFINTDLTNDLQDSDDLESEEYLENENVDEEADDDKLQYLLESKSEWRGTTKQISDVDVREMKVSDEEHVRYLNKDVKDNEGVNCLRLNLTISVNIYNNSLIEVPSDAYLIANCSLEEQNLKITWKSEFGNFNNSIYLTSTFEGNSSHITFIKIKLFHEKTAELIVQQKNDLKVLKFNKGNETTKVNVTIPLQKNIFLTFKDSCITDLLHQETGERASSLEKNTLILQIASGSFCTVVILIVASIFAYKKIKSKTRIFKVSTEK